MSGPSGVGKTKFISQLQKPVLERNGYMIVAKFSVDGSRPDIVIFEALNRFFGDLNDEGDMASRAGLRQRIANTVTFGIGCVSDVTLQFIVHLSFTH